MGVTNEFGLITGVYVAEPDDLFLHKKTWTCLPSMPRPRSGAAAAILDGHLYVVGGFDRIVFRPMNSVDRFDPRTQTWSAVAPLLRASGSHAAVVCSGRLYVCGGDVGTRLHSARCEMYDAPRNAWTGVAEMGKGRADHAAVVYRDTILCFGGFIEGSGARNRSVERFDPLTQKWTRRRDMPSEWYSGAAVVLATGCIALLGGSILDTRLQVQGYVTSDWMCAYDPERDLYLTPHGWKLPGQRENFSAHCVMWRNPAIRDLLVRATPRLPSVLHDLLFQYVGERFIVLAGGESDEDDDGLSSCVACSLDECVGHMLRMDGSAAHLHPPHWQTLGSLPVAGRSHAYC